MSTATPLDPDLAARIRATVLAHGTPEEKARAVKLIDQREQSIRATPLATAKRLPWQEPFYALCLGLEWRSEWGPAPSCDPTDIDAVASNQIGKSTVEGMAFAGHVTGRSKRFPKPGEVWGGMPRLADSVATQRRHVEAWLPKADAKWYPREANQSAESHLKTKQGWVARFKAFEQALIAWESGTIQAAYLDEPPPDDIRRALRTRTMRYNGFTASIFTPIRDDSAGFHGTESQLYTDTWGPWCEFRKKHPKARWGEVAPGKWVFALGVMENAVSRGGYLPDARILADRQKLIDEGKPALALVRYGDPENDWRMEWVDMSADSLIPHDRIKFWSAEPVGGIVRVAGWIDVAYSVNSKSCETAIAIWGADRDGVLYQIESQHGKWDDAERLKRCADLIVAYGCPDIGVQRVPGDTVFAGELNRELMRRGVRACVSVLPEKGSVPDKATRAHQFAPMCSANQIRVKPEHVEFMVQARKMSLAYIKASGPLDVVDAGIGAALLLVDQPASKQMLAAYESTSVHKQALDSSERVRRDEKPPEWLWGGGRDMLNEVD